MGGGVEQELIAFLEVLLLARCCNFCVVVLVVVVATFLLLDMGGILLEFLRNFDLQLTWSRGR